MAIDTGYVDINNGNPGWTRKDVLDALETVFEQVGYHSSQGFPTGTSKQGVPHFVYGPGYDTSVNETTGTWGNTGGSNIAYFQNGFRGDRDNNQGESMVPGTLKYRCFQPKANAESTGYYIMEYWGIQLVDKTHNYFTLNPKYTDPGVNGHPTPGQNSGYNDELTTGKEVVWRPDGSGDDYTNLTCGTTYYIISMDKEVNPNSPTTNLTSKHIKLAASLSDANNGIAIDLDGNLGSGQISDVDVIIREPQDSNVLNRAIDTQQGDLVVFDFPSGNIGDFKLWHSYESDLTGSGPTATSAYASDREISFANIDRFIPPDIKVITNGSAQNDIINDKFFNIVCDPTHTNSTSAAWPKYSTNTITWDLKRWCQTEKVNNIDNFLRPDWMNSGNFQGSAYNSGDPTSGTIRCQKPISRYFCGSSTTSAMKLEINVAANCNYNMTPNQHIYPYYDVTIAGDGAGVTGGGGAGKDLKLRVFRVNNVNHTGKISRIEILNMTDGWSNEAVFTIPGEDIGGEATTHDITFGVNTNETSSQARDGKPSLAVTNIGGDTKFYQKSEAGTYAILARDHTDTINTSNGQPLKKRSRTYYSFSFPTDAASGDRENSFMFVQSGIFYDFKNTPGTRYDNADGTNTNILTQNSGRGVFFGEMGRDRQRQYSTVYRTYTNQSNIDQWSHVQISSETDPTGSPLRIYWNKPPTSGPQDKNCVLFTFVGYNNSVPRTYSSFMLNGGPNFMEPSPGVDLDNLYHGSMTLIYTGSDMSLDTLGQNRGNNDFVTFKTMICGRHSTGGGTSEEPFRSVTSWPLGRWNNGFNAKTRDSLYGYMRDGVNSAYGKSQEHYATPMINPRIGHEHMRFYYMNDTYDGNDTNYYKPVKGIPLASNFIPCPYYLPDDFVLIYFGVGPATTEFRYGDTITIGTSPNDEQYKIVAPAYDTNSQDWENQNASTGSFSKGVALCVRTN